MPTLKRVVSRWQIVALLYAAVRWVAIGSVPDLGYSETPLADGARIFLGQWGGWLLEAGAVVSILGTIRPVGKRGRGAGEARQQWENEQSHSLHPPRVQCRSSIQSANRWSPLTYVSQWFNFDRQSQTILNDNRRFGGIGK